MYRAVILFLALTFTPAVALAQQPCTTDARPVVNELYRHMLERGADAGSSHWVEQLESGRMTVRELVRQFAKSDEHTQRFWRQESGEATPYLRATGTLYRHILGRQPDAAGARSWANLGARSGASTIVDQIVGSREYDNQLGDWGVPGSGGIAYCAPGNRTANQPQVVPVDQGRYQEMDRNGDGVISRAEWRGNAQTFENQDWNNDSILSGDELDGGAARFGRGAGRGVGRGVGRGQNNAQNNAQNNRDARRAERFDTLDVSGNGRIEPREWDGTVVAFNRLDVNNDNFLSRAEIVNPEFGDTPATGTSGQAIRVEGRERWTDTGINVRAGDTLAFDAQGTVRLSDNGNDVAGIGGSGSRRRDGNAPLVNQSAGALIARIANSDTFLVGNLRSLRAPATGRLYLGVNDEYLADNSGDFQVTVTIQR